MVVFVESAFRHGYGEEDYFEVLESRPFKTRSRRGLRNVYEVYGRNHTGDYLHIAFRKEGPRTIVFHIRRMDDQEKWYYKERQR